MTGSSSIELIDQKSASVTHIAVTLVCVTKFTHSRVKWISPLLTCNSSFKFRFTVVMVLLLPVFSKQCVAYVCRHNCGASLLYFVVRVGCRRKTVHVRYLISWWASCYSHGIQQTHVKSLLGTCHISWGVFYAGSNIRTVVKAQYCPASP